MVHERIHEHPATASAPPHPAENEGTTAGPALRLPRRLARRLAALAVEGHPHEVCGLLIGRAGRERVRIARLTTARNLATDRLRDRYTLDPGDFVRADEAARREGLDVVGVWHTHPDHPARPSATDLEAAWPDYSYLILSVRAEGVEDVRSWRLEGDRFVEQPIEECER